MLLHKFIGQAAITNTYRGCNFYKYMYVAKFYGFAKVLHKLHVHTITF